MYIHTYGLVKQNGTLKGILIVMYLYGKSAKIQVADVTRIYITSKNHLGFMMAWFI